MPTASTKSSLKYFAIAAVVVLCLLLVSLVWAGPTLSTRLADKGWNLFAKPVVDTAAVNQQLANVGDPFYPHVNKVPDVITAPAATNRALSRAPRSPPLDNLTQAQADADNARAALRRSVATLDATKNGTSREIVQQRTLDVVNAQSFLYQKAGVLALAAANAKQKAFMFEGANQNAIVAGGSAQGNAFRKEAAYELAALNEARQQQADYEAEKAQAAYLNQTASQDLSVQLLWKKWAAGAEDMYGKAKELKSTALAAKAFADFVEFTKKSAKYASLRLSAVGGASADTTEMKKRLAQVHEAEKQALYYKAEAEHTYVSPAWKTNRGTGVVTPIAFTTPLWVNGKTGAMVHGVQSKADLEKMAS
jgi:hypothetical protein